MATLMEYTVANYTSRLYTCIEMWYFHKKATVHVSKGRKYSVEQEDRVPYTTKAGNIEN